MNDDRGTPEDTVSRNAWVDAICDRFENDLKAGRPRPIQEFLRAEGIDPDAAHPDLLSELDKIEAAYRTRLAAGPNEPNMDETRATSSETDVPSRGGISAGTLIAGKYKLLEIIGQGGMGTVWSAEQTAPMKRSVAVKVIKPGMDSHSVLARFEAERQALAILDHPNIARVLDAGSTPDGRPFFVMELVKGVSITTFCDEGKLTPRQRLELFVPVCQAIQHAHMKGIIHRDIKPSNVLVAEHDGLAIPKVIDFGVAKATGEPLTDRSLATGLGTLIGTAEYMSPEQAGANRLDIDTRSDVYSLGVLLYELLTGTTPVDRKSLGRVALEEILRVVREVDAPRPSQKLSGSGTLPSIAANRGTEPLKLSRLFRGELDWVLLKSLEKDRTRRYESANAFADDVRRYLDDEVVKARPPSNGYRLKKFVRRNKVQVIAASLVLATLVAGVIGTTLGLLEAKQARADEAKRADRERDARKEADEKSVEADIQRRAAEDQKATAVAAKEDEVQQRKLAEIEKKKAIEFRNKALDALRSTTGEDVEKLIGMKKELTAKEKAYLNAIAQRWQTFAKQEGTDEQSRAISAEGHYQVAKLWLRLGRPEEARPGYEQALALWEKLTADFPAVPNYRSGLATSHDNLGILLDDLGKRAEAEEQYRKGLTLKEKLAADFPAVPDYRSSLADSHDKLGILLKELGKRAETAEQFRKGLTLRVKLAADFPAVPEYRFTLSLSHHNLGVLLYDLGKLAQAEEQYKNGLALQEKLAADFPAVPDYCRDLAISHNNLGNLLTDLGKRAEAEEQFRKGLAALEKLAADFPSVPEYRSDLANSHNNLGLLLADLGKRAEAEEQYGKGLALQKKLATDFPTVPHYRSRLAGSHNNLGLLLADLGKRVEAEAEFTKGVALQEKLAADFPTVPHYRSSLAGSHYNLGNLLAGLRKRVEAEAEFTKGVALQEKLAADFPSVPEYRVKLGGSYCNFGILVRDGGKPADSLVWFDKAIKSLRPVHEAEPRAATAKQFLRNSHGHRAIAYDTLGQHAEAVKDWDRAIELSPPQEQPAARAGRAKSRLNAGMVTEAITEVVELTKSSNWNLAQWYNFACVYALASGKIADKKQEYADRAMALLRKAIKVGYNDSAHMKRDADLDPLRDRDDFQKLIAELEKSVKPEPKK